MSSTFCPLPWMFQAIRNNGDLRICCQANVSEGQGILKSNDGANINARTADLSVARNAELMKDARLKMLKGEWPTSCKRCRQEEAAGLRSRRIYENTLWADWSVERALRETSPDGSIDTEATPVLSYDVRFGNKCNLKCRMCGPTDSDSWYGDFATLFGPQFQDTSGQVEIKRDEQGRWFTTEPGYSWFESPEFWRHMEKNIPYIRHLHIVGGEPLLIYTHYDFLEKVVSSGFASQVVLEYNTNLTVLPDRALKLWAHFKEVRIGVSVDGVEDHHEYIRYPGRWPVLEKNLLKLDQAPGNFEFWMSCTVQVFNIFHLPDLVMWKLRSPLKNFSRSKRLPFLTTHMLHHPPTLNVRALPAELKEKVRKRFAEFKPYFRGYLETEHQGTQKEKLNLSLRLDELLDSCLRYMDAEDWSPHFTEFADYTGRLDKLRGQNWAKINPEFQPWLA